MAIEQQVLLGFNHSAPAADYIVPTSLRLRGPGVTAYLSRTPAASGNRKTFTISFWFKPALIGTAGYLVSSYDGASNEFMVGYLSDGSLFLYSYMTTQQMYLNTSSLFRDPATWYHVVCAVDTTQAIAANRAAIYVNNVAQPYVAGTLSYPAQNIDLYAHVISVPIRIGAHGNDATLPLSGDITEFNWIDGQSLTPSSFGKLNGTTNIWVPTLYSGSYGSQGDYLPFSDTSALTTSSNVGLGKNFSGSGNYWTTNNISITAGTTYDSLIDTPSNNYAVLNPLNTTATLSSANLNATGGTAAWYAVPSTIAFDATENKYFEFTGVAINNSLNGAQVGIISAAQPLMSTGNVSSYASGYVWQSFGGLILHNSATTGTSYNGGATYTTGDVIGVQLNNGTLTFYKNGVSQGTAYTGITGIYTFAVSVYNSDIVSVNFGQRPFSYAIPTGATAVNSVNIPTPATSVPGQFFDTTIYTGTQTTNNIVNTFGFLPDLVWLKGRSATSSNYLIDSSRGVTKTLSTNTLTAEATDTQLLTSLNSNGFTLGTSTSANTTSALYVGWQWKKSATAGIDIVTYTGNGTARTIAHSLGAVPKFIIVKARSSSTWNWPVQHTALGAGNYLYMNTTGVSTADSTMWNNTAPTSSVFSVGTSGNTNENGTTYVAYLFSEVAGFSKFGSYTGNANNNGPFVYCGFKPKFIMIKRTDTASYNWWIEDTSRDPTNPAGHDLTPTTNDQEFNDVPAFDFLSNGFKARNSAWLGFNASGGTYVYVAFAQSPLNAVGTRGTFNFTPTISADTTNYNLRAAAIMAGWNQTDPLNAVVTVNSGVYVSANSTATYAFDTGVTFPAGTTLALVNNGFIIGMGGAGGAGSLGLSVADGSPGAAGGPALRAQQAISVTNASGTIGGGGGGGGGGAGIADDGNGNDCNGGYGGGGRSGKVNSAGGNVGTYLAAGASQPGQDRGGSSTGGFGGAGGNWGSAGVTGGFGDAGPGAGGAAGAAVAGNSNITWVSTGTRLGAVA